jgi:hypothetical protein
MSKVEPPRPQTLNQLQEAEATANGTPGSASGAQAGPITGTSTPVVVQVQGQQTPGSASGAQAGPTNRASSSTTRTPPPEEQGQEQSNSPMLPPENAKKVQNALTSAGKSLNNAAAILKVPPTITEGGRRHKHKATYKRKVTRKNKRKTTRKALRKRKANRKSTRK